MARNAWPARVRSQTWYMTATEPTTTATTTRYIAWRWASAPSGSPGKLRKSWMPNGPPVSASQFVVDEPDDLGEPERHERQIVPAQPEGGEAGQEPDRGRDRRAHEQAEPRRDVGVLGGGGGRVGPEREEPGVAERDLPGVAAQQVPARGQQRPDHRLRGDGEHERVRQQHRQQRGDPRRRRA